MMTHKNPTKLTIKTPEKTETVEGVETWRRDEDGHLIVTHFSGFEREFELGEIII